MDIIINQTQSLLCEDYLDLDADDSNAAKESALTLVAKVISPKKINAKLAYSILLKAWNPSKGMQVKHQEDNVFSISFNHEWDRKRILDARPWSIMSSHLVLRDWPANLTLDELEFHHSPFWIRIYGLPPNQMTKSNAERIGARIGELKDIDFTADGNFAWYKFLRIQVVLDIRQPIHTGFHRTKEASSTSWIHLRYERLPDFCFNCGRIGHVHKGCSQMPLSFPETKTNPYGPWLRADSSGSFPHTAEWNPQAMPKEQANQQHPDRRANIMLNTSASPEIQPEIAGGPEKYTRPTIPPSGSKKLSGGLCLAWKNGVDLEITLQTKNIINALIFSDPPDTPWMLSAVYGPPHWECKRKFWTDMSVLAAAFEGPWTCIGDFNAVANQTEKKGGRPVANPSSGGICEFINQHHMIDLGFSGNPFTWSNNRPLSANIKERLDKAYANAAWCTLFPDASVTHLPGTASDHLPIVLKTHKPLYCGMKPFKFEAAWTRDPTSHYVVQSAWSQPHFGTPETILCRKVECTSKALRKWNSTHFGHIQSRIGQLMSILDKIQQSEPSVRNLEMEKNLKVELQEQLCREEWLWHQKSRLSWKSEGDLNTKFFHLSTDYGGRSVLAVFYSLGR
ncbi:hypothetical protein RJ639_009673 [Escallonia herrerae]|uniref:CCHC-type domain-containing protein n=1 Tax=Escallonia herrerae TaxID=1293975 RepID=A0AA89AVH2_9ASTE|nr:hypothetical protein RJ639_009673 [Escallonia herrerae]